MKRMQTDDNSEQLDLLMSSLNAIKKELRAIKTNMTLESKLDYTNQDLMAMFDVGTKTIKKWRDCGELAFTQRGSIYLYSREDINEFLRRNHFDLLELVKSIDS